MKRIVPGATPGAAALALLAASLLAGGCQNAMYEENAKLHDQNRKLQQHLSTTSDELDARPTEAELVSLQQELAARDQMIADLQAKLAAPGPGGELLPDIGQDVIVGVNERGDLTMSVAGDVLFASGSTTINKSAEATLARIADILKSDYGAQTIRVEGHTDTDPISKTKKLYNDNRDLSLKRAYAVTTFLEGKGVPAPRIETVGHGEHRPKANKKDSRRVEIFLVEGNAPLPGAPVKASFQK